MRLEERMPKVTIQVNVERCKGCEYCVFYCPAAVLKMSEGFNSRGYHYCVLADESKCTGCTVCGLVCPDLAIEVYRAP